MTGGASGLGRATVEQLLNQGGRVVICDLPSSQGQETAKQLKENVAFVPIDVSTTGSQYWSSLVSNHLFQD